MPDRDDRSLELFFEQLVEGRLSRREVLRGLGAAGLTMSSAGTLLAACGGTEGTETKDATKAVTANHPKVPIDELIFSNWPYYIDKKTIPDFEKRYDAKVKYIEDIADNETFFGKVRQQLQRGDSLDRDLVVLTNWMAARWIRSGWVEAIDKRNIPNAKNLVPVLRSPAYDPSRSYTLTWQSGITAIGYNREKTGRDLTSIDDLFDPKFKGKVSMLTDPRDSAGLVLLSQGKKTADATIDDILGAIDKIDEENRKGQIRSFNDNSYYTQIAQGDLWVATAYSGDMAQLARDKPEVRFLVPEQGGLLWDDNLMIPQKAPHPYAAEVMMNYLYDPKVAARLAAFISYFTPVVGTKEELAKIDPKAAEDPLIFPDDQTLSRLQPYFTLNAEDERTMIEEMQKVVGG